MKSKIITIVTICMFLAVGMVSELFAAKIQTFTVSANVPTLSTGLDTSLSKVVPTDCTGANDTNWTSGQTAIAFGTLTFDSQFKIFRAPHYYVWDIGVLDNSGTIWTLTHTKQSVANGTGTANLDNNINVVFAKTNKTPTGGTEANLDKVTFANSGSKAYTKTQIGAGNWLRIYYGIASGIGPTTPNPNNCTSDAADNMVIDMTKPSGSYGGSVTITLTP